MKEGRNTGVKRCSTITDRLAKEGPAERELQKAKNQLAANFYRELETISGKALVLGRSDVYFGDPKSFLKIVDTYDKVTAADVKRVARAYLAPTNRTVTVLIPEEIKVESTAATPPPAGGQR